VNALLEWMLKLDEDSQIVRALWRQLCVDSPMGKDLLSCPASLAQLSSFHTSVAPVDTCCSSLLRQIVEAASVSAEASWISQAPSCSRRLVWSQDHQQALASKSVSESPRQSAPQIKHPARDCQV
jgi:hypothetical protein